MKTYDEYNIIFENTSIPILIHDTADEMIPTYEVGILEIGEYTNYVVEKIKEDLLREGILDRQKSDNELTYEELKRAYVSKVEELLKYYLPICLKLGRTFLLHLIPLGHHFLFHKPLICVWHSNHWRNRRIKH